MPRACFTRLRGRAAVLAAGLILAVGVQARSAETVSPGSSVAALQRDVDRADRAWFGRSADEPQIRESLLKALEALARSLEEQGRFAEAESPIRRIRSFYPSLRPRAEALDGLAYDDWLIRNLRAQGRVEEAARTAAGRDERRSLLIVSDPIQSGSAEPGASPRPPTERYRKVCVADAATGEIDVVIASVEADGTLRKIGRTPGPIALDPALEAQDAPWYRSAEAIVWRGKTYRKGGEWQESALNRYLRHQGLHRGVPLFSLWPGGDRVLAVLVDQERCIFGRYEPEGEP